MKHPRFLTLRVAVLLVVVIVLGFSVIYIEYARPAPPPGFDVRATIRTDSRNVQLLVALDPVELPPANCTRNAMPGPPVHDKDDCAPAIPENCTARVSRNGRRIDLDMKNVPAGFECHVDIILRNRGTRPITLLPPIIENSNPRLASLTIGRNGPAPQYARILPCYDRPTVFGPVQGSYCGLEIVVSPLPEPSPGFPTEAVRFNFAKILVEYREQE